MEEPTPLAEEHETPAQQTIASARLEAVVRIIEKVTAGVRVGKPQFGIPVKISEAV